MRTEDPESFFITNSVVVARSRIPRQRGAEPLDVETIPVEVLETARLLARGDLRRVSVDEATGSVTVFDRPEDT